MTPVQAIRAKCLDCCGGQRDEVRKCLISRCPLYQFRMGSNPNIQRKVLSEDERIKLHERMATIRARKVGKLT